MAISKNLLLKNLAGHLGKQPVFKQHGDLTVVIKYPDMEKRKFSEAQLQNQAVMEAANEEAKRIMAVETMRHAARVRLNVTGNKLYTALVREFFANVKTA